MAKTKVKEMTVEEKVKPAVVEKAEQAEKETAEVQAPVKKEKKAKAPKRGKKIRSKKYQEVATLIDKALTYPLNEAIELAKKASFTKFPATLEVHLNTNVKSIRGLVTLPFSAGKKLRILAFGKGAEESGADMVGDEAKIAVIEKGRIDFDVLVTTPAWMPKLARIARVLGPRGVMPSPKNGTISDDLAKVVAELQGGKTEYKTQANAQVIHLPVGKATQPTEEIAANIKLLYQNIGKSKISKVVLAPTMGPGVKINPSSL